MKRDMSKDYHTGRTKSRVSREELSSETRNMVSVPAGSVIVKRDIGQVRPIVHPTIDVEV